MINRAKTRIPTYTGDTIPVRGMRSGELYADVENGILYVATSPTDKLALSGGEQSGPTITWEGDQISINGTVSGPHLTGPQGEQGMQGTAGDPSIYKPFAVAMAVALG